MDAGRISNQVRAPSHLRLDATERRVIDVEQAIAEVIPARELRTVVSEIGLNNDWSVTANAGQQDTVIRLQLTPERTRSAQEYAVALRHALTADPRFADLEFSFDTGGTVSAALNFGASSPIDVRITGGTRTIVGNVVEEEERDYLASEAAVSAARANVARARADFAESGSTVEAAAADVDLKKDQIEVARKDVERARVVADYGKVDAPFDGVVVRRAVDPASFVQNATTGVGEPLISAARIDLVTVAAKFPDTAAPFVMSSWRESRRWSRWSN